MLSRLGLIGHNPGEVKYETISVYVCISLKKIALSECNWITNALPIIDLKMQKIAKKQTIFFLSSSLPNLIFH